ncbi:MAG: ABC transporter permease subunit [Sandaracinaceae bacterium]
MIALYAKELRQLWPLALLGVLLFSGDVFYRPFTEYLDQMGWEDIASYVAPSGDGGFGVFLAVLAFAAAYSAFPREQEEGTLDYLLSLPIRPRAVFVAKALAGLTLVAVPTLGVALTDGLMGSVSHESLRGDHWTASIALSHVSLHLLFAVVAYGHGLLASTLRLFGLLPYVLLFVLAGIFEQLLPALAWADPTELLIARYVDGVLVWPTTPLLVHLGLAVCAMWLAYLAWLGPAARWARTMGRVGASLAGKMALGCATVLGVVLVLVVALVVDSMAPSGPSEARVGEPSPPPFTGASETGTTERYRVRYPVVAVARANALMEDADAIHAALQAQLAAEPGPVLVADLTEVSGEHRGIASWTHIRVGLVTEPDESALRHTFAHETAHAFQHRLSDRRQGENSEATRFFAEGSAEWLAYEVVPGEAARTEARIVAAASWDRHSLRMRDVLDDERLRARLDTTLVYPLGEVFAASVTDVCGPHAIGDTLRAMGREDAPRDLDPIPFWEDTLRAAGCDLERVGARFATLMAELVHTHRDAIERYPRVGVTVASEGRRLTIEARTDRPVPEDGALWVVLRRGPESSDTGVVSVRASPDPEDPTRWTASVASSRLGASRLQVRGAVRRGGWAFSEAWRWVAVD